jgi:hypothetical protein
VRSLSALFARRFRHRRAGRQRRYEQHSAARRARANCAQRRDALRLREHELSGARVLVRRPHRNLQRRRPVWQRDHSKLRPARLRRLPQPPRRRSHARVGLGAALWRGHTNRASCAARQRQPGFEVSGGGDYGFCDVAAVFAVETELHWVPEIVSQRLPKQHFWPHRVRSDSRAVGSRLHRSEIASVDIVS